MKLPLSQRHLSAFSLRFLRWIPWVRRLAWLELECRHLNDHLSAARAKLTSLERQVDTQQRMLSAAKNTCESFAGAMKNLESRIAWAGAGDLPKAVRRQETSALVGPAQKLAEAIRVFNELWREALQDLTGRPLPRPRHEIAGPESRAGVL